MRLTTSKNIKYIFIHSYHSNHIYDTQLIPILNDSCNHKFLSIDDIAGYHKKEYLHMRSCTDIYYDEFDIINDIIIESSSVKLLTKNGKFIKVRFNNDKTKVYTISPFNKIKYKKDINFINKYVDIFRICEEYCIFDNIKDMIHDINDGLSLKESLRKYVN